MLASLGVALGGCARAASDLSQRGDPAVLTTSPIFDRGTVRSTEHWRLIGDHFAAQIAHAFAGESLFLSHAGPASLTPAPFEIAFSEALSTGLVRRGIPMATAAPGTMPEVARLEVDMNVFSHQGRYLVPRLVEASVKELMITARVIEDEVDIFSFQDTYRIPREELDKYTVQQHKRFEMVAE